jgi:glutathione S-transferase
MTKIRASAFRWVPPFAQGLVRDLRVRWALQGAEESAKLLRSAIVEEVKKRLASLCGRLDGRDYLEDRFTAADLLMVTVLHPAPYGSGRGDTGARLLPPSVRGAARIPKSACRPNGALCQECASYE